MKTAATGNPFLPLLFAATLFTSATLLFWVQPLVAKLLLPWLGGSPSVWNTCMVFFQALLLAGYAWAHWAGRALGPRGQAALQITLLALAGLALPFAVSEDALQSLPRDSSPVPWLLGNLALMAGLPFFVLSTLAPLLQKWFAGTAHPAAREPYFLYAASNVGSFVALLSYPVLVEPHWPLLEQSRLWRLGYFVLVGLCALCAVVCWRTSVSSLSSNKTEDEDEKDARTAEGRIQSPPSSPVTWPQRARWIFYALVPSSLMLGVTTYLTTDIAAVPLLWVIPLALYLLTFVLVFARKNFLPLPLVARALPIAALTLVFVMLADVKQPPGLLVGLHLALLFIAALVSHGCLAAARPDAAHLTDFYLCMSLGGALGGLFNALAAPLLFDAVVEYPLAILLACLVRPAPEDAQNSPRARLLDFILPAGLGVLTAALAVIVPRFILEPYQLCMALIFGLPLLVGFLWVRRPLRFALALGAVMLGGNAYTLIHGRTLHTERNFFGTLRVARDPDGLFRRLYHGTTVHGLQFLDPARQGEPLAYYHRRGPLGNVFELSAARLAAQNLGVIGLGGGAMACYAQPGQRWDFYEIDPAVVRIARDTNYFTYLHRSPPGAVNIILGDARMRLREAPDGRYALFVVDAFSSDVIPMHLLTREAVQLYFSKLKPGGFLAMNISSRNLELAEVVGGIAKSLGLFGLNWFDDVTETSGPNHGKYASHWVVLARDPAHLGELLRDGRWRPLPTSAAAKVWTDDFSDILSAFRWR
ncbi:MAG: fused MFS/spermidine synthase [Verrucomicrobia bacterium]|nr:fused MFS/spermidine synthase [Verrucomicrobiota bacterium]